MPKKDSYKWIENNACTATYKVLEGDNFLDQFEDANLSFAKAASVKLRTLRYFPKATNNNGIIDVLSYEIARKFITYIVKIYTVSKQKSEVSSGEIFSSIANIFADGDKTILDLAEAVDNAIKFPDEA
jgi:hypothetical protein